MKFAIDYGHTLAGADTGAIGNGLKEQVITRDVGKQVTAKLRSMGHSVVETAIDSSSSVTESLSHRTNLANSNNVDMFVSIHVNAGGGKGTEIYTWNSNSFSQATNVLNNLVSLGFNNRGIKDGSGLYVIRHSKAKAMLVELFFIDSSDTSLYTSLGAAKLADAIVKGLVGTTVQVTPQTSSKHTLVTQLDNETKRQGFSSYPTCRQGASGGITKILQHMLLNIGYPVGSSGADGIFGQGTVQAVQAIQSDCGLSSDGIVGHDTWNAIIRNLK